jgi:hypothetical protein
MIKSVAIKAKDGRIFLGRAHGEIIDKMPGNVLMGHEKGFTTSTGEFVDRVKAAKIAFDCGQISEPKAELFSNDLSL